MDKDLIKRINELAKKKKTLGLNAEEQAEQKQLYAVYLAEIREQFDNTSHEQRSTGKTKGTDSPCKRIV